MVIVAGDSYDIISCAWYVCEHVCVFQMVWRGTHLTAQSMAAWAIPMACAATPTLPASNVVIAILKPIPMDPRRFSRGTLTHEYCLCYR